MMATAAIMSQPPAADPKAALQAAANVTRPKHRPANLKSPLVGTYPSSIQSPLSTGTPKTTPKFFTRDGSGVSAMRTPITPPSAYMDFLKAVSPAQSPGLSTGTSTHFSFTARSPSIHSGFKSPAFQHPGHRSFPPAPLSARPSFASHGSTESNLSHASAATSVSSTSANTSMSAPEPAAANTSKPVDKVLPSYASLPPRPATAATTTGRPPVERRTSRPEGLRRPSIVIPESPSSISFPSAISARSANSPFSATLSGSYTPKGFHNPRSAGGSSAQPVVIRHSVRRTIVTYTRRPGGNGPATATVAAPEPASAAPKSPMLSSIKSESGCSTPSSSWSTDDEAGEDAIKKEEGEDDDREATPKPLSRKEKGKQRAPPQLPLVGDAPRGKRRKVD